MHLSLLACIILVGVYVIATSQSQGTGTCQTNTYEQIDISCTFTNVIQYLNGLQQQINAQQRQIRALQNEQNSRGQSYVRWGRTTCNSPATVLYTGFAANGRMNQTGSGLDLQCLHSQPEYLDRYTPSIWVAQIFGVEYAWWCTATANAGPFSSVNAGNKCMNSEFMPCVACTVHPRSQQIMIPARINCPTGWFREYWGYLVTQRNVTWYKGTHTCLDEAPEIVVREGRINLSGGVVYPVETVCLGLECPPYVEGAYITCVVCSK